METIRLSYNARSVKARQLIEYIKTLDFIKIKKTGLEEAIDDIKHGRVHEAKDVDDMFSKILGKKYVHGKVHK